jgi:chromosome segregation ATPase
MNHPPEPDDLVLRLRQQLILAQVRIMELEDERDELAPRLAAAERLWQEAQGLADAKLDESAHRARVLADLQAHADHLRHVQHVTHTALEQTRAELERMRAELAAAQASLDRAAAELAAATGRNRQLDRDLELLGVRADELETLANERARRIAALDGEIAGLRSSRSWRWTAWLRRLERALRRPG